MSTSQAEYPIAVHLRPLGAQGPKIGVQLESSKDKQKLDAALENIDPTQTQQAKTAILQAGLSLVD